MKTAAKLTTLAPWALVLVLVLAGCAPLQPGDCDPNNSDVSMIQKMRCDSSGEYRKTIDQKEEKLAAAQAENALFRQSLEALEAQRASLGQSVQAQKKARDATVANTRKLLDQLRSKGGLTDRMKTQLSLAEKDLAELQAQPIKANASNAELEARQKKVQELEQMVKRLRASVLQAS